MMTTRALRRGHAGGWLGDWWHGEKCAREPVTCLGHRRPSIFFSQEVAPLCFGSKRPNDKSWPKLPLKNGFVWPR